MRRLIAVAGMQAYAFALAFAQSRNGVRTDEAKYLLDIPYPHPPLARWFLGLFDGFAWQEFGARVLFATLMAQAAWLVWDMGRALKLPARVCLCALWLGSAAFVLQAGTVMMAPLTALQALVFLWWLSKPREALPATATVALFWLATLFTALQGVLLAPLAVAVLRLKGASWGTVAWYVGAPLVLVALYAVGNPLVMASFGLQAGKDAASTFAERGAGLLWILALAGSGVGAVVGVAGLALKRHWFILASFALFAAYVFLGRFEYYTILFLPFFVTGAKHLWRRAPVLAAPSAVLLLACTALLLAFHRPLLAPRSPARYVLRQLPASGTVLLEGSFGHEWQYEASPGQRLLLYSAQVDSAADVAVCFDRCEALADAGWMELEGGLANTWWKY